MPRQKTFMLVPNPVGIQGLIDRAGHGVESKPPMTSKQAKKLYQQANRGPRLSKAEQRRLEREEQDRIRQEFEKEKQANKARILREKKKAKEQQVIDEKKKRGLPLVTVRPSQDTIARFVRGNGAGKKRDSAGVTVELPAVTEEAEAEAEVEAEQADFEVEDSDCDRKLPADGEDNTRSRKKPRIETAKEVGSLVEGTLAVGAKEAGGRSDSLSAEVTLTAAAGGQDKETVKLAKATRGTLPPPSLATVFEPITCGKFPGDKDKGKIKPGWKISSSALSPRQSKGPGAPKKLESAKKAHSDSMTAPLTSTQLFVIHNIDDFPTLSQEELEEAKLMAGPKAQKVDAFRPPFAGFAKPTPRLKGHGTQAKASMPPPSRQHTRQGAPIKAPMAPPPVSRQISQQTAHVKPPMAPPPRPVSARPAKKALEPSSLPFFSTQDLLISSQDLRDLYETTTTLSEPSGGMRPPPFKKPPSVQRQPSHLVRNIPAVNSGMVKAQLPKLAATKLALVKQSSGSARGPTRPRPLPPQPQAHDKRKDPIKPSNVPNEKQGSQPKRPTLPGDAGSTPLKQSDKPVKPAPRSPSPEKPRFFGPSGSGVQLLLALSESRKTHEAEERRRRAEQALAAQRGKTNGQSLEQERRKTSQQGKPKAAAGGDPGSLFNLQQQSLQQENNTKIPSQCENVGNQKIPPCHRVSGDGLWRF
ncbi:hypothetical protein N0V88_007808 [Collariella sp. IMI 366227]|nr:hypothetical protein N0V88_007808 [Collariella sp. IMI 366227]